MSGVYIKGMEMPKTCLSCPLQGGTADCRLTQKTYNWGLTKRPSDCPLVPVPPHGRLIDADALCMKLKMMYAQAFADGNSAYHSAYRSLEKVVNAAPTIIPASFENLPKNERYSQDNLASEEGE